MKKITEIPYEVTFVITPEEKEKGRAKRLIMLPLDDIIMTAARREVKKSNFLKRLKIK